MEMFQETGPEKEGKKINSMSYPILKLLIEKVSIEAVALTK